MYGVEFRPLNFESVYGLEVIKEILQSILKSKKYDPGYLFTGSYSSGKTTLARIFSRAILCKSPQSNFSPCNKCTSCKEFLSDRHPGYIEIDAANSGTKDKIKELKESFSYEHVSNYRIVLFDEAHNISKEGKDALLNQLEQSGKNIIMMFCTTECDKMPLTIRSRCMEFQLQDPTEDNITKKLIDICDKKNIEYDKDALYTIIRATGRHYRDAENKLRQISLLGPIDKSNVKKVVTSYDAEIVSMLCTLSYDLTKTIEAAEYILSHMDISNVYESTLRIIVDSVKAMNGVDFNQSYKNLLEILVKQYGKSLFEILDYLLSKNRLNDPTVFHSDLLVLHYKFLRGGFEPKDIEAPKKKEPSKRDNIDPMHKKIKEAEDLPPWDRDELLRKMKNERNANEKKDKKVSEKVSYEWGPDKKGVPSNLRKKGLSRNQFVRIIGNDSDEERI